MFGFENQVLKILPAQYFFKKEKRTKKRKTPEVNEKPVIENKGVWASQGQISKPKMRKTDLSRHLKCSAPF